MQTKEARKVLRQYHEAVKALLEADYRGTRPMNANEHEIWEGDLSDAIHALRALLPQADAAVKALTERFP